MSNIIGPENSRILTMAGDFIGFTFDNIHSSELNLVRVSNGSRYESNLLPSFQDATVLPDGKDGFYYFGSTFKERVIKISTAFDSLTEKNYRKMIEKFSDKKMHKLIFDETPYKFYYVKLKSSPSIKNLCFDEGENRERIYKGEMDLEFVCPTPYAFSRTQHLNDKVGKKEFVIRYNEGKNNFIFHNHILEDISNGYDFAPSTFEKEYDGSLKDSYNCKEWQETSRLEEPPFENEEETLEKTELDLKEAIKAMESEEGYEGNIFRVYNPGDIPADIKLIYTPSNPGVTDEANFVFPNTDIILYAPHSNPEDGFPFIEVKRLGIKEFKFGGENTQIAIDSKTHLISGLSKGEKTGYIFNRNHIVGDFFEIPKGSYSDGYIIKIVGGNRESWHMEYTYYYV